MGEKTVAQRNEKYCPAGKQQKAGRTQTPARPHVARGPSALSVRHWLDCDSRQKGPKTAEELREQAAGADPQPQ